MINLSLALPIVTNIDREWALDQCPAWCQRGDLSEVCGEIVDDGGWLDAPDISPEEDKRPNFSILVMEEAQRFERHYAEIADGDKNPLRRSYGTWSSMWRKGWWPRVEPRRRFPKSAPREFHPFFKSGSPEFERALKIATAGERNIWSRFGIAQFRPDDPRLVKVAPDHPIANPGRISPV